MPEMTQAPADARTVRPPQWLGLVAAPLLLAGVVALVWLALFPPSGEPYVFVDLDYYRAALAVAAAGMPLYAAMPYPPFAMVMISPLGWFSPAVGNMVWTAATIMLLLALSGLLSYRLLEALRGTVDARAWLPRAALSGALLLLSWPVDSQLTNGQLSIVVITLTVADLCGVLPKRFQGVLVGLAAAIKLTPLVFVPFYLICGRRREAVVSTASFAVFTGIGFLLYPSDSLFFWSHTGKSDQFGDPCRTDNLSIRSALCRISPGLDNLTWLWLGLGIAVVLAALWQGRRAYRAGQPIRAALTVGVAATVVAPIAWPHYFLWLPLAAVWLLLSKRVLNMAVGAGIFAIYSLIYMSWVFYLIGTNSPQTGMAVNVLVLVPILIAVLGLPRDDGTPGEGLGQRQGDPHEAGSDARLVG